MAATLIQFLLCVQLLMMPVAASAQALGAKDPLGYPLKTYGFMLAMAILGGIVSFYAKVRSGEVQALSIMHFIGEVATSAFAGLLTFYVCEYLNVPQILTAPLVGVSGHMGAKAISMFEDWAKTKAQVRLGTASSGDAQ